MICISIVSISQVSVSTLPENKNVVIEDLTGIHCGHCPDGAKIADQIKFANPNDVVVIGVHSSGYAIPQNSSDPDFRTGHGSYINSKSGPSGYPNGNVNRRIWSGSETAMGRGSWKGASSIILQESSPVNIGVEAIYKNSNQIEIDVSIYYTSDVPNNQYIHVLILQDSIAGYQIDYNNYYPARRLPNGDFLHMDVLRATVTSNVGQVISNTDSTDQTDFSFTYNIFQLKNIVPVIENMKVVILITDGNNFNEIITAKETHTVDFYLGVEEISIKNLRIYPNPTSELINIEFDTKIQQGIQFEIYDIQGKKVLNVPYTMYSGDNKIQLNCDNLNSGIYNLVIITEGKILSEKIIIE